ncbi:response regulator [Paenalkalicoccus suaedae]|uniref:Response regulator n=1 Tax=Paenalkalicoccus suaedae TaxID=2592382 RepID=A0A859FIL6_9BACI|nr:response regulator [Paenalkalicoccus suaedae]QKS72522.1 response regulator [Paenalkalicoccus suaedae]
MIHVLILDDDPMVARLNEMYVQKVDGFASVGVAHSFKEASRVLADKRVDLLLLDIYIGTENGLALLQQLRTESEWDGDVILITAASDMASVKRAMHLGAVDYIMKPFDFDRFQEALYKHKQRKRMYDEHEEIDQARLDDEWFPQSKDDMREELPKGLSDTTLLRVIEGVVALDASSFSTEEVAEKIAISRVTVRKYLKYLAEEGYISERLTYGSVGRPQHLFLVDEEQVERLRLRVKFK